MTLDTKWIRTAEAHDLVLIGKETVATASDYYVIFNNLVTGEERIEYFNSPTRGEGACCLAGHPIVPVFSTAERRLNPRIFVHTFPDIKKVAECKLQRGPYSYISCCFAGTEYLLSLTSFPNYQLIVWLWRTGEKMASIDTMLVDERQIIEASPQSSCTVFQYSETTGKLRTYEIYTFSKKVTIVTNHLKSIDNKITSASWTFSGSLLICDSLQNVYLASADVKKVQAILCQNTAVDVDRKVFALPYYNGFVLADGNSQLICFDKLFFDNNSNSFPKSSWTVKCKSHPLSMKLARHKDTILINEENGKILQLSICDNKTQMEEMFNYRIGIQFICLLKPEEKYLVLVDDSNCLNLIDVIDAERKCTVSIPLEDEILCMTSHPAIPLVAMGTSSGKCLLFRVPSENMKAHAAIPLQQQLLDKIKFSRNGSFLGVVSSESKYIYSLKTVAQKEVEIVFYRKFEKPVIDFLLYDDREMLKLLVLVQTHPCAAISDCIEIYAVHERMSFSCYIIHLQRFYNVIEFSFQDPCGFLGLPYLTKQIHFFQIEDDYSSISLINSISSEHKIRKFSVNTSKKYILTCGLDGLVITRKSSDPMNVVNTLALHHYQERGAVISLYSQFYNVVISLGKNGNLICFAMCEPKERDSTISSNKAKNLSSYPTPTSEFREDVETWLEQELSRKFQMETEETLPFRNLILSDLGVLKRKVSELLNSNREKSIECQLSISTFDLNVEKRKTIIPKARCKREENEIRLQDRIKRKEIVINYMIENFWNSFRTHDCSLISFNSKIRVDNFCLRLTEKPERMNDFYIELFKTPSSKFQFSSRDDSNGDVFLFGHVENEKEMPNGEFGTITDGFLKHSDDLVYTGSTSFAYLSSDPLPNQLSEIDSGMLEYDFFSSREYKLKMHFNEEFDKLKSLKSVVLETTSSRLEKLRKYEKELEELFRIVSETDDSKIMTWNAEEIAENVITLTPEDLSKIQPDLSMSGKDEHSDNSVDTEKWQIPEHVVEFRQEKLEEIMDGQLEIRWEDEVRKVIPKPKCLLTKNPAQYDEDDIKTIQVYKEKVKLLEVEREKYKEFLQSQIQQLNVSIQSDVETFDEKIKEFGLKKIKVKSAILQEFLLRSISEKMQTEKRVGQSKLSCMIDYDLATLEKEYRVSLNEISKIEPVVVELRNKFETLNKRDKALESKFRGEFAELKQPLVEHLLRQYKRRPRISQIACTSLTCLAETNKCLVAGRKSAILPREYLDFLRGIDALDVMPSSLPPQIDVNHWQILCKLRRNKVEMEIKLKICALELAEAEQTYFYVQKLSSSIQSKIYFVRNNVEEESIRQTRSLQNRDIQLVLKAAQIEICITGHASDFENAALVAYQQLVEVNKEILSEGEKKIEEIKSSVALRKSIIYRKWKYQCMSKKLRHWQEHLSVLQSTKISKEMQNFLVERLEGNVHYRDATSSDKMLKSMQKKFQRMFREEKINLRRILNEIKFWRRTNAELITRIELFSLEKQTETSNLDEDPLRKRNRAFHSNHLLSIMERTNLVEQVKSSRKELLNLQTQLELLKLKTYPTLRFKNTSRYYVPCIRFRENQ